MKKHGMLLPIAAQERFSKTLGRFSGEVAQLVRVPPCHGGCCGFKSRLSRHFFCPDSKPQREGHVPDS